MILDQFPEVQLLTRSERLALAAELVKSATTKDSESDPEIVALLDQRPKEYEEDPSKVSPWSEVKERILNSSAKNA